ncbi:dicarboxylate/amino acid:cation symporter [Novosphingobium sp. Gsoil 351]|uniref:dicarboxylate/amino acid:cation symporter n=1 Tax=Novosphingobium sp. Gsoil 351 TaxID=2675225 RepID=UPI0012B45622|nr:cation:dicarboxylase symporter family transporter [Novosphingobium sp. Gsoil 351]QGN54769.1 cation:dicarboxylase symporter family transporter [Novosphingobium sp. Gsoil 351]
MSEDRNASPLPEIRVPTAWTFAGLVAGLASGLALRDSAALPAVLAIADPVGALWLRGLQMTILPLVAALLFTGIVRTVAAARGGTMARASVGLFAAILLASAVMAALLTPLLLAWSPVPPEAAAALRLADAGADAPLPTLADFLAALVPDNVVAAAAGGALLPVVVFMTLFALASTRLGGEPRRTLQHLFEAIAGAMLVVVGWVLALAPIGVMALALGVAAKSGAAAVGALAHYIVIVSTVGGVVLLGAYAVALGLARQSPRAFAAAMLAPQTVALSTQSSLASLPAMLSAARRLGLSETSADYVLPLAVALFRATSPAMNIAVAVYVAHLAGVELTPAALAAGVAVSLLSSLGAPSLPGSISFIANIGPIALAMGVPIGPLALLVAVEMLPDLMRTVGNVTMDVAVAAAVDRRALRGPPS